WLACGGDFSDTQLMRNQIDARRLKPPGWRTQGIGTTEQRLLAEIEPVGTIDTSGYETLVGARNGLAVIELGFIEGFASAAIDEQPLFLGHAFDDQTETLAGDFLPDPEFGTRDRRAVYRVLAQHARGCVEKLHAASFDADQRAKTEFRFGVRDIALTRNQSHQCSAHFRRVFDYPL